MIVCMVRSLLLRKHGKVITNLSPSTFGTVLPSLSLRAPSVTYRDILLVYKSIFPALPLGPSRSIQFSVRAP